MLGIDYNLRQPNGHISIFTNATFADVFTCVQSFIGSDRLADGIPSFVLLQFGFSTVPTENIEKLRRSSNQVLFSRHRQVKSGKQKNPIL